MTKVSPSILSADFARLGADCKEVLDAGASCITFHIEASDNTRATIAAIRACGCGAGLAINPNTPAEAVFPYLDKLSLVLVMGVTPGHGGQPFQASALDKLRALRAECQRRDLHPMLSVDGGVKAATTGPQCVEAGANVLVAGSAVFCAADKAAAVQAFQAL